MSPGHGYGLEGVKSDKGGGQDWSCGEVPHANRLGPSGQGGRSGRGV